MNMIAFYAVASAVGLGFVFAEIFLIIKNYVKAHKCQKHVKIKNVSSIYSLLIFAFICVLRIILGFGSLSDFNTPFYSFSKNVEMKCSIACYGILLAVIIIHMIFGRTYYITENGITGRAYKSNKNSARYSIEKLGEETLIKLYTKSKNPDITFTLKKKNEQEALALAAELYPEYDSSPIRKKHGQGLLYALFYLVCGLICAGALIIWYFAETPVIFVKNVIVPTDTEWAMFWDAGYLELMFTNTVEYYDDINGKQGEMLDNTYDLQNLTPEDIVFLKELPNLKHLDVITSEIDDLTTIGELTQLEGLAIGGGEVFSKPMDYSPLKKLTKLKYFIGYWLYNFNDMTVFENADDLAYFIITDADIQTGLDVICEKENLLVLEMYSCTADDFSPIGNCSKLKRLVLAENNIDDLSFIENLKELEYLRISNINAENYSVLLKLPLLKTLSAHNCDIPDEIINELTEKGVEIFNYTEDQK